MKPLSAAEAAEIERAIQALEARVGVEVVAAVLPRSDEYPEIAWRAFALGASVAALVALAVDIAQPDWTSVRGLLLQALTILGVAAASGAATYVSPGFSRLFLGALRAATEVRQRADALFLERELFATARRDAVLVLVSTFEHRVVVVADRYWRDRVTTGEWDVVVRRMTPYLRQHRHVEAFRAGLSALEALLVAKGATPRTGPNVLPDALLGDAPR